MENEENGYECTECGATFESRRELRRHIYDDHIDDDDRKRLAESDEINRMDVGQFRKGPISDAD